MTRDDKTFLTLSHLADKLIRVVLVRFEDGGWVPHFCTDPNATVRDMLEAAADRWAIEEHFHDVKEVWVAGQQQVRHVWSNIGCWHLNQWLHTLVELAWWDEPPSALVSRAACGTTPTAAAQWPWKSCAPNFPQLHPQPPKRTNTSPADYQDSLLGRFV